MIPLYVLIGLCIAVVAADVIVRVRRKPVAPVRRDWGGEVHHAHAVHAASIDPDPTPPHGIPRPR